MTIIIAGHNLEEDIYSYVFKSDIKENKENIKLSANGIFVLADSSISNSNGEKVILGGFRKIYPIPIKVWKPYFTGEHFRNYLETHYEAECFVAIAGSTLTAQHVLNSITTHLSKIRISYQRSKESYGPGKYIIQRHCQRNELEEGAGIDEWDDGMFIESDYKNLVTADSIANIIEYSINESLSSAQKYKLGRDDFRAMQTEFAVGIYCPTNNIHKLFTFRMRAKINTDGVLEVFAEREEIAENDIAILGMRDRFELRAKTLLQDLIKQGKPTGSELFTFLNNAINEVKAEGNFSIDRPSVHKQFNNGKLTIVNHQN